MVCPFISELKKRTLSKEQFVANWNNQTFIGEIIENEFEIKLSKVVRRVLCCKWKNWTIEKEN
jgi:hypothetical protein